MKLCETIFRKKAVVNQYIRHLKNLREALKTADTKEKLAEIKKRYKELESSRSTAISNHIAEIKEISEAMKALELDYQDSIATLEEFKVVERKENGEIFYKGDYDGRKEAGGEGKNFTDAEFTMPPLESIFARMTQEKIKLYAEMKEKGLEPHLQLTPIAKTIRSLAKHIDDYKGYPGKKSDTFVKERVKDKELIYEPEDYDTSGEGKELITIGGKTKSKWIKEHNGWIVDIVATVQKLEAEPEIETDANNKIYTTAEKAKKYHKKYTNTGYRGMTFESWLVAQMRALRNKKPLDRIYEDFYTILTDSPIKNINEVSRAYWDNDIGRGLLYGYYADRSEDTLSCRPAVRVLRKS